MMRIRSGKTNLLTAAIFLLALFMPLIVKTFPGLDVKVAIEEKRELAVRPTMGAQKISAYPALYEKYFNDHFGYRNLLIMGNNFIRFEGFNVSGSPKVLAGKNQWLFYTGGQMIEDHRGLNRFEPDDLVKWQEVLEDKRDWLAAQGIEYLFVVAPNKPSVYPENLPRGFNKTSGSTPTDQLLEHLQKHSRIQVVDLRQALLAQKDRGPLFKRLDTHWTSMGAFLAYEAIARRIAEVLPSFSPITEEELLKGSNQLPGGDLATMLGLQDWLTEESPSWYLPAPAARRSGPFVNQKEPFVTRKDDRILPRAIMFRDSFATALVPLLSENFRSIKYFWERWHHFTPIEDIIQKNRPAIVIEEVVERNITFMKQVTFGLDVPEAFRYPLSLFAFPGGSGADPVFLPVKHVELEAGPDVLRVVSTGNDPSFLLPQLDTTGRTKFLITLEFTSPVSSSLQLFYQTESEAFFDEAKSLRIKTDQGVNTVSIPLANGTFSGVIRLDPGSTAGDYVFTRIEVRCN